ncbi:hypothetical protein PGQ11_014453 [Apiospora arundinis]|uniref:Mucin-7 n=1 Tax=Apiospora arundinis TaxID=335852 RepID=A0ABR2HSV3_9PEZI
MSGVKNLRAMFEQKTGDSPPDRGRSPPGSASGSVKLVRPVVTLLLRPRIANQIALYSANSPTPSQSPRPLSKVRLNFVAIEKDGRIGLQREPSRESASVSDRRQSNESESTTPAPVSEKGDVFSDNMAQNAAAFRTNLANEPIPESPRQAVTPPSRWSPKVSPRVSPKISPQKGTETPDIVPNSNPDKITDEEETKTKLTAADPTTSAALHPNGGDDKSTANGVAKNGTNATKTKTSPISTTGKTTAKAPKSPLAAPKSSVRASSAKPTTPQKSAAPVKKPASLDLSPPSVTGFVKPKVKSPTRPAKLPASLTTHTAASALKTGAQAPTKAQPAQRETLSRTSGNHLTVNHAPARPHSRNSATTAAAPPKTLKRQNSTINRPRPSIGPPPKQMAKDHPVVKKEAHVDESFLARMMRPTAASASKTTEKAPITPPKKHNVPAVKKSSAAKDGESHAKRATAKLTESTKAKGSPATKKPAAAKGPAKAEPSAKEVAPVAAQAATADVAIEAAAVSKDTAVTPVVEKSEPQAVEAVVEAAAASSDKETAVKESETVEEAKVNGAQESTVPVILANPKELNDVEDVVQEAPAPKSQESNTLAPAAEITPAKTEEVSVDASETY